MFNIESDLKLYEDYTASIKQNILKQLFNRTRYQREWQLNPCPPILRSIVFEILVDIRGTRDENTARGKIAYLISAHKRSTKSLETREQVSDGLFILFVFEMRSFETFKCLQCPR